MKNERQEEIFLLKPYRPLIYSKKTYFIITGGRNSAKSFNVALYFCMKLMQPQYFRGVIARYQKNNLKFGMGQEIQDMIDRLGIRSYLDFSTDEITNKQNGNKIISHAFKITDHAQVAKSKGLANNTHLVIDEAQELGEVDMGEDEYEKAVQSFRSPDAHTQIIVILNPTTKFSWMFERWWLDEGVPRPEWLTDHCFIHTTYLDNVHPETGLPLFDPKKVLEYERTKVMDYKKYCYDYLGWWSDGEDGRVFEHWDFTYEPDEEADPIYGLDFGFSADPVACVEVIKHNDTVWIKEVLYGNGMTNQDIHDALLAKGVKYDSDIIADSAEPKSIEELRRLGFRKIRGAYKGPDSIRAGINRIKGLKVHVDPNNCEHLKEEYHKYIWKRGTDKPMGRFDHLMDAFRYALSVPQSSSANLFGSNRRKGSPFNGPNR